MKDMNTILAPVDAKDDLYYAVHKGLRLANARLLVRIGQTDPADATELAATLGALREAITIGTSHLTHENAQIHSALEARVPGASDHAGEDHDHHEETFAELSALAREVEDSPLPFRARALRRLYQRFALFLADDLRHMHEEETELMPLLMENFTAEERAAIEHRIVSNIPPAKMTVFMRYMLPALSRPERSGMLAGMRQGMPAEAFDGLMTAILGKPWDGADITAFERLA